MRVPFAPHLSLAALVVLAAAGGCDVDTRPISERILGDSAKVEAGRAPGDSAVAGNGVHYSVGDERLSTELGPGAVTPVKEWRGTGWQTTEAFAVRTPVWRVITTGTLTGEAGNRRVSVFDREGNRAMYVDRESSGTDTTYLHAGPGIFHVNVTSRNMRWGVRVEEMHLSAERVARP